MDIEERLRLHSQVEQCTSIAQLRDLCRRLIERDIAYQEILKASGISSRTIGLGTKSNLP